ncbi:hypothetical protein K1719_018325 [Acacia pycnantha]|nr:hypothetical protein K1719_018325 [Acacia pycnantha]
MSPSRLQPPRRHNGEHGKMSLARNGERNGDDGRKSKKQKLRFTESYGMSYSNKIVILDIRSPTMPMAELERHRACVNAIAWAMQLF